MLPTKYKEGLPRVSAIVESLYPFEWSYAEWRFHEWVKSYDYSVKEYMDTASIAWTEIHLGMEKFINWEEFESSYPSYIEGWKMFLQENNVIPIEVEKYIATDRYQGTIDLIAEIDWELWLLDWKSYWCAQDILWIRKKPYKYVKPYSKLLKASLQLSLYAEPENIINIWVIELSIDWYHFHKLKRKTKEELDSAVDYYYKNIWL